MLAKQLKKLREANGKSQQEVCNALNIEQSTLANYENGKRIPKIDILINIASYYNVSIDYLLGLTDSKSSYGTTVFSEKQLATNETVGNSLSYWVFKSGYNNKELAEMLGISAKLLDDFCSGVELPSLEVLMKLSEICEVSTDCLLGLREKSRPKQNSEYPFRFDPEISRRLKEQAAAMNESNSFLADVLGIEENEVSNFFEYGFVPNIMVFVKIVEHFLVSSDYLLNRTGSTLTVQADEDELLRSYRALNPKSKTMALSRIYELEREESLVAAKNHYLDSEGKSSPSSGTEGGAMVG